MNILFSSVSEPDPHWIRIRLASWILIRIPNTVGKKLAKTEGRNGKNGAKRQKIHHKKLT
jgi:hypothetical protein